VLNIIINVQLPADHPAADDDDDRKIKDLRGIILLQKRESTALTY
jgi:hypothetical protein